MVSPIDLIYIETLKGKYAAVGLLCDYIDNLCCMGKFDKVDEFLSQVIIENQSTQMIVSILAITNMAKTKLKGRERIIKEAEEKFLRTEGIKRTEGLLKGFK